MNIMKGRRLRKWFTLSFVGVGTASNFRARLLAHRSSHREDAKLLLLYPSLFDGGIWVQACRADFNPLLGELFRQIQLGGVATVKEGSSQRFHAPRQDLVEALKRHPHTGLQ